MARAHVVLPDELLEQIDELVGKRKRSEFIANLLEKELRRQRRLELFDRMAGALKDADIPEWETPETIDAWVRKQRNWLDPWAQAGVDADADAPELQPTGERTS